jgi:hypothetical protein
MRANSFLSLPLCLSAGIALSSAAAKSQSTPEDSASQPNAIEDNRIWRPVWRDAVSTVWEGTEPVVLSGLGDAGAAISRYVEVASGLNYQDADGQWQPSQDLIELMPDGTAAALRGPTKAHFNPNP